MPATQRERLKIVWDTITRDVERDGYEMAGRNSKRWQRIDDMLTELAAMLVHEIDTAMRPEEDLSATTEAIWQEIESRLLIWADNVETERSRRREAAAA